MLFSPCTDFVCKGMSATHPTPNRHLVVPSSRSGVPQQRGFPGHKLGVWVQPSPRHTASQVWIATDRSLLLLLQGRPGEAGTLFTEV